MGENPGQNPEEILDIMDAFVRHVIFFVKFLITFHSPLVPGLYHFKLNLATSAFSALADAT
jgi:hypothetical protein